MWVETIAESANMTPSTIRLAVAALLASLLPAPTMGALREQDPAKQTALDKYVAAPDDNFAWMEIPGSSWKGPGFVAQPPASVHAHCIAFLRRVDVHGQQ